MLLIFSTPVLIRHPWQLKAVVFQHWHLTRAHLLDETSHWLGLKKEVLVVLT
jgi:hypothetical protein